MISIEQFERELAERIGRPSRLRPFVCEGSPLDCQVFIVGFNPATSLEGDFWQFWRSGVGFDKRVWLDAYQNERMSRPLAPGIKRRNSFSNTRRVIEWILKSLKPVACLETNIHSMASRTAAELPKKEQVTCPFDYLLGSIKPAVIVSHGEKAKEYFCEHPPETILISESHFSRGWSESKAADLAARVRTELAKGGVR